MAGTGEGVETGLGVSVGGGMVDLAVFEGTRRAVGAGVDSPAQEVTNRQTNKDIKTEQLMIRDLPYEFHTAANLKIRERM